MKIVGFRVPLSSAQTPAVSLTYASAKKESPAVCLQKECVCKAGVYLQLLITKYGCKFYVNGKASKTSKVTERFFAMDLFIVEIFCH